jgi:isopenicillin N synthase-like dioxygenase
MPSLGMRPAFRPRSTGLMTKMWYMTIRLLRLLEEELEISEYALDCLMSLLDELEMVY